MAANVASAAVSAQRLLPENDRRQQAKANLRNAEDRCFRSAVGACIERARLLVGWSLKELAARVGRDERQVARWITGAERPAFDALFAVPELRQPLVIALAELGGAGVEIETIVRVRRIA